MPDCVKHIFKRILTIIGNRGLKLAVVNIPPIVKAADHSTSETQVYYCFANDSKIVRLIWYEKAESGEACAPHSGYCFYSIF